MLGLLGVDYLSRFVGNDALSPSFRPRAFISNYQKVAVLRPDGLLTVLDAVLADAKDLRRKISSGDQQKLDEYLDSVREIETRIGKAEKRTADASMEIPERPSDIPGPSRITSS